MSDLTKLAGLLPKELIRLSLFIQRNGFSVGIVGGAVRNFFLFGDPGEDFDLEIRPLEHVPNLLSLYQELLKRLKSAHEVEVLNYQVARVAFSDFVCEISLPRIEHFNGDIHHSNFEAEYIADMDYSQGFKRRDFTLNAMCVKLGEKLTLIDPLGGYEDLLNKELIPCSEDFYKDPVRFLRAVRFATKYNFVIANEILDKLQAQTDLTFTDHYLRQEAKKSEHPFTFFQNLLRLWKGEDYQLDQKMVQDYEVKFLGYKLKDFFQYAYFIPENLAWRLAELTSFKFQAVKSCQFKQKELSEVDLAIFKKLAKLPSEILNFYYEHGYFDLNSDDLYQMKNMSVDLSEVEPKERGLYELKEKLRSLHGN